MQRRIIGPDEAYLRRASRHSDGVVVGPFAEQLADLDVECLGDLRQRTDGGRLLAPFQAGEIALVELDLLGKRGEGQTLAPTRRADAASDDGCRRSEHGGRRGRNPFRFPRPSRFPAAVRGVPTSRCPGFQSDRVDAPRPGSVVMDPAPTATSCSSRHDTGPLRCAGVGGRDSAQVGPTVIGSDRKPRAIGVRCRRTSPSTISQSGSSRSISSRQMIPSSRAR